MPWYKLPHCNHVMWFDQKMDLRLAKKPGVKHVKPEPEPGAAGSTLRDPGPATPAPEPEEEAEAT